MEYATLGKTGRTVSRLGFGGATAGLKNYLHAYDPAKDEDRAPIIAAIGKALELGVTYFDVAPGYGSGAAESIFGEALEKVDPATLFLATKVGIWTETEVRRSLEESLGRLRRDRIDLLQIHGTHYTAEHEERIFRRGGYLDQMEKLREEGLVTHLGFTCESITPILYRLLECGRFEVIQMCYNLLFQHAYDPGWKSGCLYDAERLGLGIAVMRSTTSGIFQKWVQMVNPANAFDYTAALIQFQLSNPAVDVALIGMRSAARVLSNVAIVDDKAGRIDLETLYARYV